MQPPLDSAAGFSEATVRDVELYIKWTGEVDFVSMQNYTFNVFS